MATDDGASPSETTTGLGKGLGMSFLLKVTAKVRPQTYSSYATWALLNCELQAVILMQNKPARCGNGLENRVSPKAMGFASSVLRHKLDYLNW